MSWRSPPERGTAYINELITDARQGFVEQALGEQRVRLEGPGYSKVNYRKLDGRGPRPGGEPRMALLVAAARQSDLTNRLLWKGDVMVIRRIVPNLRVADAHAGHDFYVDFLGLEKAFDLGWVASFRSPDNPGVQVSLVTGDATAAEDSVMSVDVGDVDIVYARARQLGYEIVHPLTDESWGVRRFFVRDPHGNVINIVGHPD